VPTKIERAEVRMQNKKRRTRRSHGDDDKDSPEAIIKSIAAAVQLMDSEILRILGTILIPEDVLPSIAGVPEGDWLNFMGMVKAGAIRMADEGRGIDFVEARSGSKRTYLCHIWDTQSTKPAVSLSGHIRLVELLHSHKCGNMTLQELTTACFKGTCTGTAKKVMGPSLAESILGLETPPRELRGLEARLLNRIRTIRSIHDELLRPIFPAANSAKQEEEHSGGDDESDNGPVNRDASLIAQVDCKIHGHAEAQDPCALWTQEWLLNKASDSDTRRQFASLYRNKGNEIEFSLSLDSEFEKEWSETGRPSLFGKKGAGRFHLLSGDLFDGFKRYSRRGGGLQWALDLKKLKTTHEAQLKEYYSPQAFFRTPTYPIIQYLVEARKYNQSQQFQLTHVRSGTGEPDQSDTREPLKASETPIPMDTSEPDKELSNDATSVLKAMMEPHPQNKSPWVTHRVVFLFFALRVLCQVSDSYSLLLQYLTFLIFFKCLPSTEDAKRLFNYGSSLSDREMLVNERLKENLGEEVSNAPGAWYFTSDASNVGNTGLDVQTRRIHFRDKKKT